MIIPDTPTPVMNPYLGEPGPAADPPPSWRETFDASMFTENTIQNAIDYNQRKEFPRDPNFDLVEALQRKGIWEDRNNYIGTYSEPELDFRIAHAAKERKAREIVGRAGWRGYVTDMAAGNLDPTIFLPFLGAESFGKAAIKSAVLLGSSAAAQEAVLYANQQTREGKQSAMNVGAATVLGGLLGTLIHGLSKKEIDAIAKDMVAQPEREAISPPTPFMMEHEPVGAEVAGGGAGRLKSNAATRPVLRQMSRLSPITRGIEQPSAPKFLPDGSPVLRDATQKFGQAGLRLEGNVEGRVALEGGNVENMIKTYSGPLDTANRAIEQAYKDYVFAGKPPAVLATTLAKVKGQLSKVLMDFDEFKRQVSIAQWADYNHPNEFVVKAAKAADKHIQDMFDEAVEVGIFTGKEAPKGDSRYLSHLWDTVKINSGMNKLIDIFTDHYEPKLRTQFREGLEKLRERQRKGKLFVEDAERSAEEVQTLTEKFKEELQKLEDDLSFENAQAQLEVANLRERARKAQGAEKEKFLSTAREKEGAFSPELNKFNLDRAEIRRRLSNLSTARSAVDARFRGKLERIEKNEELQLNTLLRGAKQAQKLLKLIDSGTDKEVAEELSKFKTMFAQTAEAFDNAEEKIVKMTADKDERIAGVLAGQESRMNRLDEMAKRIDDIESFDKEALAAEVEDAAKEMLQVHAELNARRAVRNERLKASAQRLSPEEFQKRLDAKKAQLSELEPTFRERQRVAGGENIDLETGSADFSQYARNISEEVVHKLRGTTRRLAYSDLIQQERGIELARVLDIPAAKVLDYLETDIEKIMSVYTRTLAADISLTRAFGSSDMAEVFLKLKDERTKAVNQIKTLEDKKGKPLSDKAKADLEFATNKFYDEGQHDLEVLLERSRGIRGLPTDPNSMSARMSKTAMEINGLRYLGGVIVASISDPARIVQRHGLLNTFSKGFIPFITKFKEFKMNAREARLAGTANDMVMHTRLNTLNDVFDDAYRGTYLERGIHYAANKMGNVAGFNQWTQAWKQLTSGVAVARLSDAIAIVAGGEKASAKELQKATEYLASVNITPDLAETMWKQISNGVGGGKQNGVWLPNTESWDVLQPQVKKARRAFRAALAGEIDDTIITPGLERPNWTDANLPARMLAQFKSFALSSTQKTLMAGLQQHDAAYLNGLVLSLSLGALSYYLYATAVGGETEQRMLKSIDDGNWQRWADEAISRSGQTAIFDSLQRVANRVPVMNKFSSFSGGPISKLHDGGMVSELGGPSLDLISKMAGLAQGVVHRHEDGTVTGPDRRELHLARQLMPFQNLFYLRRLLNEVENATGDTLGLEGKRQ